MSKYSIVLLLIVCRYDEFAFEMFYDEFVELLSALVPGEGEGAVPPMTAASLLELFTGGQQQADCYTWYMRLLTAGTPSTDSRRLVRSAMSVRLKLFLWFVALF